MIEILIWGCKGYLTKQIMSTNKQPVDKFKIWV